MSVTPRAQARVNSGAFAIAIACVVCASGCPKQAEPIAIDGGGKNYGRQLPPGQLALRKITDPEMLPDYKLSYYSARNPNLREAVQHSIAYLSKPSSGKYFPYGEITHQQAADSLQEFLTVADSAGSPEEFDRIIKERFDTWMSVGCDDEGTVLFTGYYCPIFDGSLTRTEKFRYPLYKKPADLQTDPNDPDGKPMGGRYLSRQAIENGSSLAGQEIAWLGDKFEAYVISVQGSGKLRLPDGRFFELGYAANNGYDYTSVGRELVADGKLSAEGLSLDALIAYFRDNPQDADTYLQRNQRYIFFREAQGGPFGCLGTPVLPLYSIATDKEIFPRGCLAMYETKLKMDPTAEATDYSGFCLDQDRGAAIRAPGRCDIFRGTGDAAGKLAGHTYNEGKLYYLFLKSGGGSQSAADGGQIASGDTGGGGYIAESNAVETGGN